MTVHHYCRIRKNQLDVTGIDVYSHYVNSTCFEHHYAHFPENRLYKNCVWCMPCCVGCSRVELGHELCALCESCYTQFFFGIVCSPDDEHNDARNMLS